MVCELAPVSIPQIGDSECEANGLAARPFTGDELGRCAAEHDAMSVDRAYSKLAHPPRLDAQRLRYIGASARYGRIQRFDVVHLEIGEV